MKLASHPIPSSKDIFQDSQVLTPVNRLAKSYRAVLDEHYARDAGEVRQQVAEFAERKNHGR